ncbi:acyltransferase [Hymenobacter setariae]|uniref:Acyltransferase n=1 Tax=Hymenobacter setariae TaxID=2594794 RepID=A0A558BPK7_9BACT|nr:acyltransferase [Hymenobacter setariae]TVT38428.1 acyltransferase [Hymenobacter setariae]
MRRDVAPKTHYYRALTGLRAVAAYTIFWHHLNPLGTRSAGRPVLEWANHFVQQWHVGVPIFFVLSGFLIAQRYAASVAPSWTWAKAYLQNRFARIYPLYLLITVVTLVVQFSALSGYNSHMLQELPLSGKLLAVVANLTLLKALFSRFILATGVAAAWSLTVEMLFYISVPVVLLFVKQRTRRLVVYPVAAFGLGVLLVAVCAQLPFYSYGLLDSLRFMLNCTFFGRCSEFACGMAVAYYLKQTPQANAKGGWLTVGGGLWIILCTVAITQVEWQHPRDANGLHTYAAIAVNNLLLPPGIALLLVGLLREQTWFRTLLETKVAQVAGKSSYAFYLLHDGLLRKLSGQFVPNSIVLFIAAIVLSIMTFYLIEEPLHRYFYVPTRPLKPSVLLAKK